MNLVSRVLAPAIVLGLLLSGCGGGGNNAAPTPMGATLSAAIVPASIGAGFVNPASASSPVGTNLTQVVDYSSEYPFVNMMKQARPWFSGPEFGWEDDPPRSLALFGNGDVRSLEPGQVARTVLFDVRDPHLPDREFDVFYTGVGTLRYDGRVERVSTAPGHDRIRLLPPAAGKQTVIIVLTSTDPVTPLRQLRVLPVGGICAGDPLNRVDNASLCPAGDFLSFELHDRKIVFNPDFLRRIQTYRGLRFMDWMRTNVVPGNTVQVNWQDRPKPGHAFWSTGAGVPLEVMIALANLMGMDPWFNIPHAATDDYVTQFATLVRDQLDPARTATIEYSNEVWNDLFGQAEYVKEMGAGLRRDADGADNGLRAGQRFYARRARQVMEIFVQVFNGTTLPRPSLNRVMATQFVSPFLTRLILNFEDAFAHVDQFAVAPYFAGVIDTIGERDKIKEIDFGADGIFKWILDGVNPTDNSGNPTFEEGGGSLLATKDMLVRQRNAAASFGLTLTSYEGGQHLVTGGDALGDKDVHAILLQVNGDARMREAYARYLKDFLEVTGQPFYHFRNVDQWGTSGYWGALRFQTQPRAGAPKYDALMTFIAENPR